MVLVTRMFIGSTNNGSDPSSSNTWRLSVKVGDLIMCDHYGMGIVIGTLCTSFEAYFYEVGKKGWFGADNIGVSMEVISESR